MAHCCRNRGEGERSKNRGEGEGSRNRGGVGTGERRRGVGTGVRVGDRECKSPTTTNKTNTMLVMGE